MMLFKPFVLIAVALSAFQAQAAPTHSHIQNDLMKMSEQASTFNAAVKALPGPRAMDKKIAAIHMTATRLRSATAKTAKDVHNYRGIEFSDPEQEKINHSWAHIAQSEVDALRQLLSMKQMVLSGKSGHKDGKMIASDLSHLQRVNDGLAHALVSVLPSQEDAVQATLKQLEAQFAETIEGFGSHT